MTAAPKAPRVSALALSFQTELDRLSAEPAPPVARLWPALGLGLLVGLAGMAALLPVDVVVTAQGQVAADAPPILLRPIARGVLQELLVQPGDIVQAGQVLARLDATLPQADRAALLSEQRSLRAEIARYEAELSGGDLTASGPETMQQADILARRRTASQASFAALDSTIEALSQEEKLLAAMGPTLAERLAIAAEVEGMRRELANRQSIAHVEVLAARAARLTAEAEVVAHQARQADLSRRLRAARDQREVYAAEISREASEALPRLRLRLSQIEDALAKAERLATLTDLVAPRAGVVISVAPGGVGAIAAEGEPLVVLVPSDAGLVAEISIASADLGRVAVGDLVSIKVDAFPFRRFGLAEGRIESLGPVSFTPEGGSRALHPARVSLLSTPKDMPHGAALVPGMTLSAEVLTGTRTVLDYFLAPIERGLTESLREP